MGMWLIVSQIASVPQVPIHGSLHLLLIHALSLAQSEFRTHSGLHPKYGSPWYSGIQVHSPSSQIAFEPHGEGEHRSTCSEIKYIKTRLISYRCTFKLICKLISAFKLDFLITFLFQETATEWISCISWQTRTYWQMVVYNTLSIISTCPRTGVQAHVVNASRCCIAFGVYCALGSAPGRRTFVIRYTSTTGISIYFLTNGIRSTGWWNTRVNFRIRFETRYGN